MKRPLETLVTLTLSSLPAFGVIAPHAAEGDAAMQIGSNCERTENLLAHSDFSDLESGVSKTWSYSQHAGGRSFVVQAEDGVLTVVRDGKEPWMLLKQRVKLPAGKNGKVIFSSELQGDLQAEPPLHAFEHKGGLYLRVGRSRAMLAAHEPNIGQWEWAAVAVEAPLAENVTRLEAGFVHQAGGQIQAKNPELVVEYCDDL